MGKRGLSTIYLARFTIILLIGLSHASFLDYIPFSNSLFTSSNELEKNQIEEMQKVPYEVALVDEKFIEQAAQLTGISLSNLDKCQHRVILKLQQDCHKLNDEEIAKLAVKLLNCQSSIEGRQIYPCTDVMQIRDCTSKMDTDTWNSYLLMSNRARAVCYSIRQAQFRGLTELTVNKLMGAAHEQLDIMSKIKEGQSLLELATSETLKYVVDGNEAMKKQQEDLRQAQFHGQLVLEDNIRRLVDEKQLILEGHEQLTEMTKDVREKLDEAAKQIEDQADAHKQNHMEILNDLVLIQQQAETIFMRIEQSSKYMLEQSALAAKQYEDTLAQLAQVNSTVYSLMEIMSRTRSTLEAKLNWLTEALGGTDNAVERLYLCISHITYLILAMISCAFLQIPMAGRFALIVLVPLNLTVAIQQGVDQALSFFGMTTSLIGFIVVHSLILAIAIYRKKTKLAVMNSKPSPKKVLNDSKVYENDSVNDSMTINSTINDLFLYKNNYTPACNNDSNILNDADEINDSISEIMQSPTPPASRYSRSRSNTPKLFHTGSDRRKCHATTRMGKPCSMTAQTGRVFCFRHQTGS